MATGTIYFGQPLPGRRSTDFIQFIFIRHFPDHHTEFSPAYLAKVQSAIAILGQKKVAKFMEKAISKIPDDPWGASRYFMGCCRNHILAAQTEIVEHLKR